MNRLLHLIVCASLVAVLAGCVSVVKVGPGEVVVKNRVSLQLDAAWNQLEGIQSFGPATIWTQDGFALDLLRLYCGLKDGELLVETPNAQTRPLAFRSTMQPQEIIGLFQGLYTRDGSTFQSGRVDAVQFLGGPGFRFEYSVVRKFDDVQLSGVAWATVRGNELFALTFTAPRAGFFPRHRPRVEQVAASARLKA